MPEERKVERPHNMYRKAAFAIVMAWMAKTRSAYPVMLALKVVAAVAFVGAAGAAVEPALVPQAIDEPAAMATGAAAIDGDATASSSTVRPAYNPRALHAWRSGRIILAHG